MSYLDDVISKTCELDDISKMDDVPYDLQMKVVKQNPMNIKYIKHPCEDAQFEAFNQDVVSCRYIINPTENFQEHVIRCGMVRLAKRNMFSFSRKSLELAFELDPHCILFFQKGTFMSDDLQLYAIKNGWELRLYNAIMEQFTRKDEEAFHNEIKKLKIEFGPMKKYT
ncbi:hypothetical protein PBI_SCTP2_229 [Salicola phage SCTP-2]|nr:hypothetical protein PBI_SCTP2_229 [Salicola phage SCTP-2]